MATPETFLDGKIELFSGDCLAALPTLAENSIDSCVTDPPYHLTSIVKRFGDENAKPALSASQRRFAKTGGGDRQPGPDQYGRLGRGFMGKIWDGGDIAFRPDVWREVYRVLKPGAHLLAFGGTRTYHRMACAIEDAGFEIRDTIMWVYGSGFPKSHDVSKNIDKQGGQSIEWFPAWLREKREAADISRDELAQHFPSRNGGKTGCVWNWEAGIRTPSAAQFNLLCRLVGYPEISLKEAEREFIAERNGVTKTFNVGATDVVGPRQPITAPATDAARQWEGWGTALKPACEPIVLARKPLSESTVAANVLRWGVGALNINACRVSASTSRDSPDSSKLCTCQVHEDDQTAHILDKHSLILSASLLPPRSVHSSSVQSNGHCEEQSQDFLNDYHLSDDLDDERIRLGVDRGQEPTASLGVADTSHDLDAGNEYSRVDLYKACPVHGAVNIKTQEATGRWPANLIHDGSEEVLAEFPDAPGSLGSVKGNEASNPTSNVYGAFRRQPSKEPRGDTGSAARFFYTAKADSDDRLGSKHPTVKPLDLMQYLVRLVTPKGGVTLDPFAGTGTTGEAAFREGMRAMLIEREPEYQEDIARRMVLVLGGPEERANAAIKQRMKDKPRDDGPLFGGTAKDRDFTRAIYGDFAEDEMTNTPPRRPHYD